jgi:hypothetical protein
MHLINGVVKARHSARPMAGFQRLPGRIKRGGLSGAAGNVNGLMANEHKERWWARRSDGPVAGRIVLLVGAYAPVAIIIAARALPASAGWVALGLGIIGLSSWIAFLSWLPARQPREAPVSEIEPIDGEVGAYIVSILLPLVAAGDPSPGDLVAYGQCGVLILFVAYVSNLALVNPLIYFFGYRVARATVDGERTIVLIKKSAELDGDVTVVRAVGVTFIPDQ